MDGKYILNGKEPVPVDDLLEWAKWLQTANTNVAFDIIDENIEVSTVFLGLDFSFNSKKPLLFETMIIGGEHDDRVDTQKH